MRAGPSAAAGCTSRASGGGGGPLLRRRGGGPSSPAPLRPAPHRLPVGCGIPLCGGRGARRAWGLRRWARCGARQALRRASVVPAGLCFGTSRGRAGPERGPRRAGRSVWLVRAQERNGTELLPSPAGLAFRSTGRAGSSVCPHVHSNLLPGVGSSPRFKVTSTQSVFVKLSLFGFLQGSGRRGQHTPIQNQERGFFNKYKSLSVFSLTAIKRPLMSGYAKITIRMINH